MFWLESELRELVRFADELERDQVELVEQQLHLRHAVVVGDQVEVVAVLGQGEAVALLQHLRHGGIWSLPQGPCRKAPHPIQPPVGGW